MRALVSPTGQAPLTAPTPPAAATPDPLPVRPTPPEVVAATTSEGATLRPVWLDGADVVDDDSPDAATADPLAATAPSSAPTPPAAPAIADPAPLPAESPVTDPLDDELAALSRRTRRPRRVAALTAGAAALLTLGTVVALTVPRRTVHVVGGGAPRVPSPSLGARPPALPAVAATRKRRAPGADRERATAAAPPAATSADLSAAVQAAVSGGAVDELDTAVVVRSNPPGATLFRDAKQLGKGTVEVKIRRGERTIVLALLDQHEPTRVTIDGSIPEVVIALPRVSRARAAAPAMATPRPAATGPAAPATSAAPRAHAEPPPAVAPEAPVVEPPQIDTTDLPGYPDPFNQPL